MQLKLTAFLSAVIFNIGMMFSGGIIGQAKAGESTLIFGHSADTDILDPHATGGWITRGNLSDARLRQEICQIQMQRRQN